jgi:hypothetical protein
VQLSKFESPRSIHRALLIFRLYVQKATILQISQDR